MLHGVMSMGYLPAVFTMQLPVSAKKPVRYRIQPPKTALLTLHPINRITDEEIVSVSHLAPIHDIGKIKVPLEILNKNGKLTDEEMNVVKQHPLVGAAMTQRFPEGVTTEKLNQYSYEICRHHHERYDGSGYPDGLKGNAIPMCAQVVGIVDAYDALINDRPYKRKYEPEEAIQMISNGECGAFSNQLMQCFQEAAKQQKWLKRKKLK